MDYSLKGILVMLQDLQRIHFGRLTMYVEAFVSDDDEPILSCCVFDKDGEPHLTTFYIYESDEKHKSEYLKLLELVNETTES